MKTDKPLIYSEIDEDYKRQCKAISKSYERAEHRRELAVNRIKLFAATIYRLVQEKHDYDLVMSPGNSGIYMSVITEWVYQYLEKAVPPIVNLPIYRFNDDGSLYDNNHLEKELALKTKNLEPIRNVLFVDDEIMTGTSARNTLELLQKTRSSSEWVNFTIVAEHHFFEWRHLVPRTNVNFYAYARLIWGLNNNIAHVVPEAIYQEIIQYVGEDVAFNKVMAIILGDKDKQKDTSGKGYFSNEFDDTLKKLMPNYMEIKLDIQNEVKKIALEGIEQYQRKEFAFKF